MGIIFLIAFCPEKFRISVIRYKKYGRKAGREKNLRSFRAGDEFH
jgi:hypothetical protein